MQAHARVVIFGGEIMGAGLDCHLTGAGWTEFCLIPKGKRRRLTVLAGRPGIH